MKRYACDQCEFRSAETPAYARPPGFVPHYRTQGAGMVLCHGQVREAEGVLQRVAYAVAWSAVAVGYTLRDLIRR